MNEHDIFERRSMHTEEKYTKNYNNRKYYHELHIEIGNVFDFLFLTSSSYKNKKAMIFLKQQKSNFQPLLFC